MGSYLSLEDFNDFYGYFNEENQIKMIFSRDKKINDILSFIFYIFSFFFNFMNYIFCIFSFFFNFIFRIANYIIENLFIKCGRKKIITRNNNIEPYLERYYLFFKNRPTWFPFNIFLHKFIASDDADLHDHPWDFFTLILYGGYYEYVEEEIEDKKIIKKYWRHPGFFQFVKCNHKHRVELNPNNPICWTLFIAGRKKKSWGFYIGDKFYNNEKYYSLKNK